MRISHTIYIAALGVSLLCSAALIGYGTGRGDAVAYTQRLSADRIRQIHQDGFDLGFKLGEFSFLTGHDCTRRGPQ